MSFEAEVAPPGSSLYYSVSMLERPRRSAVLAVHALVRHLRDVAVDCQEREVAMRTLEWWGAELDRLQVGEPQHPITRTLAPHHVAHSAGPQWYRAMLEGAAMDVDYGRYPGFAGLMTYCHRLGSTPSMMISRWLDRGEAASTRFAHDLGAAVLLFRLLVNVRSDARRGRCYVPEDELVQFGVEPGELAGNGDDERLRALFAHQARRIRELWHGALAELPAADHRAQIAQLALGRLLMARLREIERDGYRLLVHRVHLTPLRKLLVTWGVRWRGAGS